MAPIDEPHDAHYFTTDDPPDVFALRDASPDKNSSSNSPMLSDSESSYHTMSTLHSEEIASYFRSVAGFTFSSDENVPLIFPADATADRLDVLLHTIVRLCGEGNNVPAAVDEMLQQGGVGGASSGAKVLDVVTNSGTWVQEMAESYPSAEFRSVDVKPLVRHQPHPKIEFQVYNLHTGIMEPDATFDLVHIRQGVFVTKSFNFLIQDLHRVLKPNGYLMITELPFDIYEGTSPQTPIRSTTHLARSIEVLYEACVAESVDIGAWKDMCSRLNPSHPLWETQHLGENQTLGTNKRDAKIYAIRGFYDVSLQIEPVPLGTWHPDESQKWLGGVMRLWGLHTAQLVLPAIMLKDAEGLEGKKFIEELKREFMDIEKYRAYALCHKWLAKKI